MLFGATPFANSPFADPGGVSIFVTVSGQRLNFSVGNVTIIGKSIVLPTGQRVNLTTPILISYKVADRQSSLSHFVTLYDLNSKDAFPQIIILCTYLQHV